MRKLLSTTLILALLAIIAACSANTDMQTPIASLPDIESSPYTTDDDSHNESFPDLDGNPYTTHEIIDGETYITYDYSEVYSKLDLSQYSDFGKFGMDGLMWVEKSDYTGTQYGYIDYNGNLAIPFTSEIVSPSDFDCGYAIVSYEYDGSGMGNGVHGVINTKGEIVLKFVNHAISRHYQSLNGNIVFYNINMMDEPYSSPKNYIFCSNSNKIVEIPDGPLGNSDMYYSNGLLRTYRTEWYDNENHERNYMEVVTFYDENAEVALVVNTKSSEYYLRLVTVKDFDNEKSEIIFVGKDRNYYTVDIDKTGKWISEPTQIDKDDIGTDVI